MEETVRGLKILQALIEWEFPLDFQIVLDDAIRRIEKGVDDGR